MSEGQSAAGARIIDWSGVRETFWTLRRVPTAGWPGWVRSLWSIWILAPAAVLFGTGVASLHQWLTVDAASAPFVAALMVVPVLTAPHWPMLSWRLSLLVTLVMMGLFDPKISNPWPFPLDQVFAYALVLVLALVVASPRSSLWIWGTTYLLVVLFGSPTAQLVCGIVILGLAGITYLLKTTVLARRRLAEQVQESELERARRTILEERSRIARDLHDVVAHHMSLVVVQAESAPYRIQGLPEAALPEFASISQSAREALVEIRSLLGVLRAEDETQALRPQPGIDDVDELVDSARRAGMRVQVRRSGAAVPLRPAADIAAYRIVQEGLANVARHAAGAEVTLSSVYFHDRVELAVVNTSTGSAPHPGAPGGGHGIIGMTERAQAAGGDAEAGPARDGGFAVRAWLPVVTETQPTLATNQEQA